MKSDTAERAVYLDTSALIKLLRAEPESDALAATVAGAEVLVSELSKAEMRRFARRELADPSPLLRLIDALVGSCTMLFMDHVLLEEAGEIEHRNLGTLDAIHIASALRAAPIDFFITYDAQQAAAASSLGFNVVRPG